MSSQPRLAQKLVAAIRARLMLFALQNSAGHLVRLVRGEYELPSERGTEPAARVNRDATLVLAEDVLRRLAQHEGVSW